MSIQLGALQWAAQLVGARFPEADEEALWRCAGAWHLAAEKLRVVPPVAGEIGSRIAEVVAGEAAERFAEIWGPLGAADGPIARLADACDAVARGCGRAAGEVERAKLMILAELGVLAATVTAFAVPALWLIGGLAIAQATTAARLAILLVLERLLRVVGGPMTVLPDLDGLVAQMRTLLGLLAEAGLEPPPGGGAVTPPGGLFAPLSNLPEDLPASFGAAGAVLLAGLSPSDGAGPQGTVAAPAQPGATGGPVPPAGAAVMPPGGVTNSPVPLPTAPAPSAAPLPPPSPAPPPAAPSPTRPAPPTGPAPTAPANPTAPADPTPAPGGNRPPAPDVLRSPGPSAPVVGSPPRPSAPGPPPPPGQPAPVPAAPATAAGPTPPPGVSATAGPGVPTVAVAVGTPGAFARPATASRVARRSDADPDPGGLTDAEALSRTRACLFATDAGYGFYPPGDENRDLARAVRPVAGQVTLDLIGDAEGFTIESGRLPPHQFAVVLRELIGTGELTVRPGEAIRLLCDAAPTYASTLAAELGVAVSAPDAPLWTSLDGEVIVATVCLVEGVLAATDPPDGRWCGFGDHTLRIARTTSVS